jgi:hypothetical protein
MAGRAVASWRPVVGSSGFHNEIIDLVCDGQRAGARQRYTGTHAGVLLGLPATQRTVLVQALIATGVNADGKREIPGVEVTSSAGLAVQSPGAVRAGLVLSLRAG